MTPFPVAAILVDANRIRSRTVALTPEQERLFIDQLAERGDTQVRSDLDDGKYLQSFFMLPPNGCPTEKERPNG